MHNLASSRHLLTQAQTIAMYIAWLKKGPSYIPYGTCLEIAGLLEKLEVKPMKPFPADDLFMLALCMWREDRGGGVEGMTAVGCSIRNRVERHKSTYYAEITRKLQFSSITAPHDPELSLFPQHDDAMWIEAQHIAAHIIDGTQPDVTHGSTLYYAKSIEFPPNWDRSKVEEQVTAGGQIFFTERA